SKDGFTNQALSTSRNWDFLMLYESFDESFGGNWLGDKKDVSFRIKESFCYLTFLTSCIEDDC
ncbi:hypothetical protein MKX03_010852, partial [Papaver bracteatum]